MGTPIQPVTALTVASWDDTADVVILGYGIAGACAALEAHRGWGRHTHPGTCKQRRGHQHHVVRPVQSRRRHGPSTGLRCYGLYRRYVPIPHREQWNFRSRDDASVRGPPRCGTATLSRFRVCENSVDHFDWLENEGIPFERSYYHDKHFCPPTTEDLLAPPVARITPTSQHETTPVCYCADTHHGRVCVSDKAVTRVSQSRAPRRSASPPTTVREFLWASRWVLRCGPWSPYSSPRPSTHPAIGRGNPCQRARRAIRCGILVPRVAPRASFESSPAASPT